METSSRKTSPPPLEHHGNPPSPMLLQLQYLVCLLFNNTMPIPRRLSSDRFASHRAVNRRILFPKSVVLFISHYYRVLQFVQVWILISILLQGRVLQFVQFWFLITCPRCFKLIKEFVSIQREIKAAVADNCRVDGFL